MAIQQHQRRLATGRRQQLARDIFQHLGDQTADDGIILDKQQDRTVMRVQVNGGGNGRLASHRA